MSPETNKALVRRFYEEIDKGNLDILDELVAEDYLDHNPPPFPWLGFWPHRTETGLQTILGSDPGPSPD